MADAAKFDRQMAAGTGPDSCLTWYSLPREPVQVSGLGFYEQYPRWNRFPPALGAELGALRPELTELSTHMAGVSLRFFTDSPAVWIRAEMTSAPYMTHMSPAGQCGFDAYVRSPEESRWHFRGVTRFEIGQDHLECCLADHLEGPAEVCIDLPLYIGVRSMALGLAPGAVLKPARPFGHRRSIAVYGTSIDQGGCATRPGMAFPAILSRDLDRPFYNMGFSGNGVGLPLMADLLCQLPELGLLVVDIQANAGPQALLRQNLPPFLDRVRELAPELPLLILSASPQTDEPGYRLRSGFSFREDEEFQRQEVLRRNRAGDRNIRFASSRELLGDLALEATVDGVHLTDLGFYTLAQGLKPILTEML